MQELAKLGHLYLVTYDYTESGVTQRCGFICQASSVRQAAETFWQQHPGEWFSGPSVEERKKSLTSLNSK